MSRDLPPDVESSLAEIARILGRFEDMADEAIARDVAEKAEDVRTGRNGTWENQWFVKSDEKGRVQYKSEEAAYEGGRYWREHSANPDSVEVYVTELKHFPAEVVESLDWQATP